MDESSVDKIGTVNEDYNWWKDMVVSRIYLNSGNVSQRVGTKAIYRLRQPIHGIAGLSIHAWWEDVAPIAGMISLRLLCHQLSGTLLGVEDEFPISAGGVGSDGAIPEVAERRALVAGVNRWYLDSPRFTSGKENFARCRVGSSIGELCFSLLNPITGVEYSLPTDGHWEITIEYVHPRVQRW